MNEEKTPESTRLTPEQVARLDPFGTRKIPASEELSELLRKEASVGWTEDLINKERRALKSFFGSLKPSRLHKEIQVPPPPAEITPEKLHYWKKMGMELHFLPKIKLKPHSIAKNWKGWAFKPEEWFYKQFDTSYLGRNKALQLPGKWILIDARDKPVYQNGQQLYPNDFLAPILKELREDGKLYYGQDYPIQSRFRVSWYDYTSIIRSSIAKLLGVSPSQVRLPRAIEFNFLGNIYYPQWGETNTSELFEDKLNENRLCGGRSDEGGLAYIAELSPNESMSYVGFRPLVEFY